MKEHEVKQPVFVDLFAGCGGLSLGLEDAGFTPLFVNELNKDAMSTYLANRLDDYPWLEKNNEHDIKALINSGIRPLRKRLLEQFPVDEIDLVVGGPPCQGYSRIGHRRSYAVDKKQLPSNTLYQDMAHVIYRMKPKVFLFENVRGLLSARWTNHGGKNGEIWEDVLNTFKTSLKNYHVEWALVFAKDYGVPQNRPRVLMVGVRKDLGIEPQEGLVAKGFLPEVTGDYPHIEDLLGDLVDENYKGGGLTTEYPRGAKRGSIQEYFRSSHKSNESNKAELELTDHQYSKHSEKVVRRFQHMLDNKGEIPPNMRTKKFAQRVLESRWSNGPTITATSLPDDYVHYCQPRTLTVREWARLQMFPDCYQFKGKRTTGGLRRAGNPQAGLHDREVPKYTQIGNAVPVRLAFNIGLHFKEKILGYPAE